MKTENTEPMGPRCPKCQNLLPARAPQGLCPKCLLAAAATPTEAGQPAPASPAPPRAVVAAAFPQLEILEVIGSGGMGVVFKARQPQLDRCVALKLLPPALAADPAFAERFNREARLLARLNHPNIVTVHDFGQSGGFFYLLMEFVDGVNLRQAMEAGRFTPTQALALVPKVCEALQYAHDESVLHRDIKPSNILLDSRGRVKIADFGIAKLMGDKTRDVTLTASGAALGTPQYMAPEQLEHPQDVDQRADIYSLGVVFYEMLTGELPLGRFAPPSQKTPLDERVDGIVLKALARERELRQQSAREVKTQVENLQTPPPPQVLLPRSSGVGPGWSRLAMVSAALTGLSLPVPALFLVALLLSLGQLGKAELWIMIGAVGCLGLPGTLLGWMALSELRRSRGQLQGLPLALFAALTWPLLVPVFGIALPLVLIVVTKPLPWGPALVFLPIGVVLLGVWGVRAAARWAGGAGSAERPSIAVQSPALPTAGGMGATVTSDVSPTPAQPNGS